MARDVGDAIGAALGRAARETVQTVGQGAKTAKKASNGKLSGTAGLAAGAGLAALAPLAARSAGRAVKRGLANGANPLEKLSPTKPIEKIGDKVSGTVKDAVSKKVDDAGGPAGIAKQAGKSMIPGLGGGDDDDDGDDGGGKKQAGNLGNSGRRMPIQQAIDVGVPIEVAYNQFTQFEEWPKFMHRVDRVSQEDETHVTFKAKIWGKSKEFKAEILEQTPDERIKWRVTEGMSHTGVVTFHKLSDRLTRVDVDFDVAPGSLIEKAARGMRHIKRAVRADLSRFKAYIEFEAEESGSWRGNIDDGEVKPKPRARRSSSSSESSSGSSSRKPSSSSGRTAAASSSGSSRASGSGSRASGRKSSGSKASGSKSSGSKSSGSRSSGSGSSGSSRSSGSSGSSSRSSGSGSGSGSSGSRSRSGSSNGNSGSSSSRSGSSSSRSRSSSNGNGSSSSRKKTTAGSRS